MMFEKMINYLKSNHVNRIYISDFLVNSSKTLTSDEFIKEFPGMAEEISELYIINKAIDRDCN